MQMRVRRIVSIFACIFILCAARLLTRVLATAKSSTSTAVPTSHSAQKSDIFIGMGGITFLDAQHGWMFGAYIIDEGKHEYEKYTIDTSADGGKTWQTLVVRCSGKDNCKSVLPDWKVSEMR